MNNLRNNFNYQSKAICCGHLFTGAIIPLSLWLLSGINVSAAETKLTTGYDQYFIGYSEKFFGPEFDWRFFKSQGVVESRLRQHAKSHRGAKGVMQLMPATYQEIQKKNTYFKKKQIDTAGVNIGAGIFYDFYLYQRWESKNLSHDLHLNLMLASYNGGYSRVLKAYNKAGKPDHDWSAVAVHLPKETRNYVKRVIRHYENQHQTMIAQQSRGNGCLIEPSLAQAIC